MKKYFIRYKPFLFFLGTFFLVYIALTLLYQGYLNSFVENKMDSITKMVALNTEQLLRLFDAEAKVVEDESGLFFKLFYQQNYLARIIEGCNAVSVIILFISFVVAFSGKLKATLFFVFGGSVLIYVLNIVRIVFLTILMMRFPEQEHFLHGVVFPLFIYGVVFILWVIWVNKFSKYAK
ncbi:exosortase family protein XrtF [Flavobacterium maritimum]|uniref:exosortase family protein XrtF n=1 Tax=Flavobacterium maritimum TaxID=3149042 RepID=UPI0032B35945